MKKTFLKALFICSSIFSVVSLNSCQDALDITQPGELNEEVVLSNTAELKSYLLGSVYSSLEPSYAIYLGAVLSDELKPGRGSGGQEWQQHRFFLDNSDGYTQSIWYNNYLVINRVNRLLRGAASFTPSNADQAAYNGVIAEARALRAFAYLQLETYFSTDMKDPNALGVMLLTDVPLVETDLPRVSNQAIYDQMNADLDYARTNLPANQPRYYASKSFVNAIAARMNLYRGNYALAKQYAQDVITNSGLTLTAATPITTGSLTIGTGPWNTAFYGTAANPTSFNPYRNMWNDTQNGEVIFALGRLATGVGSSIGTYWNTNSSTANGSPMWYWGRNLFNLFDVNGDVRKYAYTDPTSSRDANYMTAPDPRNSDILIIDKYPGKVSTATRNDVKLFRLSEMYFILAECAVEENNLSQAQTYIAQVRAARTYTGTLPTPTYTSSQIAYADILKERRIELAIEGHRYIDLKRLAVKAGVSMDRNPTDDVVTVSNLANGSYKYTLPIPLLELSVNSAISGQQNTGY